MIQNTLKFCLLLLFIMGINRIQAQEAIPAVGGEASGSGGKASYSVGQLVYTTNTSASGLVAQGVQQPFEISVVTSIEETSGIKLVAAVYPNPTTDYLILTIEGEIGYQFTARIFDLNGKLVGTEKISQYETKIEMLSLIQGAYLLKVIQEDKELKTFKIIKN